MSPKRLEAHAVARTVALIFALAGLCWVLLSDIALYRWVHDPVLLARLETTKGWVFVALGSLLMYVVTFRSASRYVRAQALTAAIVESIGDGVLVLGQDRRVAYANPAAVEMLHCERDLIGMSAAEFSRRFRVSYPDGTLVPPDRFVSQRVFDEGSKLNYVALLNPPGAPELVISSVAAAVRTMDGTPPAMVVSAMHDITATARQENLRNQFFAAAAHALKTPIAVIKANVQVLTSRFDGELIRPMAAIERQCDRIDRLVQNLLVLTRARSRTFHLHLQDVELGPLIAEVVRDAEASGLRHELAVEMPGAAARVYADPERLAMVLRDLIDVAARSSVPGTPLALTARQPNGEAEIGVRYLPLPLEEGPRELYGDYDDVGISRHVAALVAQAHGGSLSETKEGPETTLWVRLPIGSGGEENARH